MRAGSLAALVIAPVIALVIAGCTPVAPPMPGVDVDTAVLLQVERATGAVLETRVIADYDATAPLVVATSADVETALLGYRRSLDSYGVRIDSGARLILDEERGALLPTPDLWLELGTDGQPAAVDVAAKWPGVLAAVRIAHAADCWKLEEVPGSRIDFDPLGPMAFISAVAPLDAERTLMAFDRDDLTTPRPFLAVLTATSVTEVALPLASAHPLGFSEADGTAWMLVHTSTGPYNIASRGLAQLCHFARDATFTCAPTEGGDYDSIQRLAGRRRSDGTLEMIGVRSDFTLLYWRGDADDHGTWRALYEGGVYEAPDCVVADVVVHASIDGDGTGIASFESGGLDRWDASGMHGSIFGATDRERRHCRSAFAQHPRGPQLFLRIGSLDAPITFPLPEVWWRGTPTAPWSQPPLLAGLLDMSDVHALGDAWLVGTRTLDVVALSVDAQRTDVPPALCSRTPVYNDARFIVPSGPDEVMIAGRFPISGLFSHAAVARWRLVPDAPRR